jgi:hypothetical protein
VRVRSRWKPVAAKMAPGADVGGAANRQVGDASMGLRSAVKGSQVRVGEKNSEGSGDAPLLSARERLRLHVNRNLAMQQHEAQVGGASDKGPASAGGPSAPPRGASPGRMLSYRARTIRRRNALRRQRPGRPSLSTL